MECKLLQKRVWQKVQQKGKAIDSKKSRRKANGACAYGVQLAGKEGLAKGSAKGKSNRFKKVKEKG